MLCNFLNWIVKDLVKRIKGKWELREKVAVHMKDKECISLILIRVPIIILKDASTIRKMGNEYGNAIQFA